MILRILFIAIFLIVPQVVSASGFTRNGFFHSITSFPGSAGTSTLTLSSSQIQVLTGASDHTLDLPDATTLKQGWFYEVINNGTGTITVRDSAATTLATLEANDNVILYVNDITTAAGVWSLKASIFATTSLLTTQGDLLGHNGTSNIRVPRSGTDGFVLTEDSSEAAGFSFQAGAAAGEVNTFSNVGASGTSTIKQKVGVDFQFKSINAGSAAISVFDDTVNDEIDIDFVPGVVTHDSLAGTSGTDHVNHDDVSITAGVGLTGGGDLTATRTLDFDVNGLVTENTIDTANDQVVFFDNSASTHRKTAITNIAGAGGVNGHVYIGQHNDCSWTGVDSATAASVTASSTCTFNELLNNGIGTIVSKLTGGQELPGIVWTPGASGIIVQVCANISTNDTSASARAHYYLYDGTTQLNSGGEITSETEYNYLMLCGFYTTTSTSDVTFEIQTSNSGGVAAHIDVSTTTVPTITWTMNTVN